MKNAESTLEPKIETVKKVFDYILNHFGENRNYVMNQLRELGVSDTQFHDSEMYLVGNHLMHPKDGPYGIWYVPEAGVTVENLESRLNGGKKK